MFSTIPVRRWPDFRGGVAYLVNVCSAAVVEKVVEYLNFHYIYKDAAAGSEIPDFTARIPPPIALEL